MQLILSSMHYTYRTKALHLFFIKLRHLIKGGYTNFSYFYDYLISTIFYNCKHN